MVYKSEIYLQWHSLIQTIHHRKWFGYFLHSPNDSTYRIILNAQRTGLGLFLFLFLPPMAAISLKSQILITFNLLMTYKTRLLGPILLAFWLRCEVILLIGNFNKFPEDTVGLGLGTHLNHCLDHWGLFLWSQVKSVRKNWDKTNKWLWWLES